MRSQIKGPLGGATGQFYTSRIATVGLLPTPLRRATALATLLLAVILPHLLSVQNVRIAFAVSVAMLGAAGLHVLVGRAGQISLASSAFLAIGAFTVILFNDLVGLGFFPAILSAGVVGGALGAVLALPALRLRGLYLILATLGFYWIVWFAVSEYEGTKGLESLTGLILPAPTVLGLTLNSPVRWYYFLLVVHLCVILIILNLKRTKYDRAWVAVRDREVMARALGVSSGLYKIIAFALSSAIISVAGALGAYTIGSVSSSYYTVDLGIQYLALLVIGGLGSLFGAYLGAAFIVSVPHLIVFAFDIVNASAQAQSQYLPALQSGVFGGLMILFLIFEPQGMVGIWLRLRHYFEMWPLKHMQSEGTQ